MIQAEWIEGSVRGAVSIIDEAKADNRSDEEIIDLVIKTTNR